MSKVNNDKISVEIDVRTSKAQEEIHKLNKATKELQKQNQEHRKEITNLAKTEGATPPRLRISIRVLKEKN